MLVFNVTNYSYWKAHMKSCLKEIDERVWLICERGWTPLTVTVNNFINTKPVFGWTDDEFKLSTYNS